MRRIDEATEQRIIQLYGAGEKVEYMAACLGIGKRTVIDVLRRNKIPKRKRLTMLNYANACKEMTEIGLSAREMSMALGISLRTVYSLIRFTGARRREGADE